MTPVLLTDQDPKGCQAKKPTVFEGLWVMCGAPVHVRHVYTCACGAHRHIQGVCVAHQPDGLEGQIGCAFCRQDGHACDVTWTPIGGRDQ